MTAAALVALFVAAVEAFSVMMAALMIFTVVMAAAFIPMMVSALLSFAVVMTAFVTFSVMMTVVVALGVGIIFQRSIRKGFCGSIRRSLNACIKLDPGVGKRRLRTHTDASADQGVSLHRLQEPGKGAVTASVGIHDLLIHDLARINIVQLELLGMAEVLEDLSVFIAYRDSHAVCSFPNDVFRPLRAEAVAAAPDPEPFAVHQRLRDLSAGALVDGRDRGARDAHALGTLFLRQSLVIEQPDLLELIQAHHDGFPAGRFLGGEFPMVRIAADAAAARFSRHGNPSFDGMLTYVRKQNITINDICQEKPCRRTPMQRGNWNKFSSTR